MIILENYSEYLVAFMHICLFLFFLFTLLLVQLGFVHSTSRADLR